MTDQHRNYHGEYHRHRTDIDRVMDWLQMQLDTHAERAATETLNYGYVGEIARVRYELIQVLVFLSDFDAADIERTLDEAREDEPGT